MEQYDKVLKEYIEYIKSLLKVYNWDDDFKKRIEFEIDVIEERMYEENLYLGVVGAFSSGKSTFINSILNKNLLPTDAVQGTTATVTIIKKGNSNDLIINYNNGNKVRYSQNKRELLDKYGIEYKKERKVYSFLLWIIRLLKKYRHIDINQNSFEKIEDLYQLIRILISEEEFAKDIDNVCIELCNKNLIHNIAIVDTPGTESTNNRHNEVTTYAIDNLCDAIVIIIPYDQPVSESLIQFIFNNLFDKREKVIYVVTKIELLDDYDELNRLIKVIKKRLENSLEIENATVIPMPTLLYLEESDAQMQKTGLLDDLDSLKKQEMIELYENGIAQINTILRNNRYLFLKNKFMIVSKRLSEKLNEGINSEVDNFQNAITVLENKVPPEISEFDLRVKQLIKKEVKKEENNIIINKFIYKSLFTNTLDEVVKSIESCESSEQLLLAMHVWIEKLIGLIDTVNESVDKYRIEIEKKFQNILCELITEFIEIYSVCGIEDADIVSDLSSFDTVDYNYIFDEIENYETIINELNVIIHTDIDGFFKTIKNFFSDPTEKHKDLCKIFNEQYFERVRDDVCCAVQEEKKRILELYELQLNNKYFICREYFKDTINNSIDENRAIINEYINKKNDAEQHILKIKQYIHKMEEKDEK